MARAQLSQTRSRLLAEVVSGRVQRASTGWLIGGQTARGGDVRGLNSALKDELITCPVAPSPDFEVAVRLTPAGRAMMPTPAAAANVTPAHDTAAAPKPTPVPAPRSQDAAPEKSPELPVESAEITSREQALEQLLEAAQAVRHYEHQQIVAAAKAQALGASLAEITAVSTWRARETARTKINAFTGH